VLNLSQELQKLLEKDEEVDINRFDEVGDAPLHRLVRMSVADKKWYDLLWCFLVYCNRRRFNVNIRNSEEGKTALHIATEVWEVHGVIDRTFK